MSGADGLTARLVVGLAGPGLHPAERAWLVRHRPAGVILFGRNVTGQPQLADLCAELHAAVPGLEIVADHEGGPVAVLAAAVGRPPAAATLGLLDDPDLTRRVHAATGQRLAACGLDRVLAPVADVLSEPRNPVIGVRAFGAEPLLVARHVTAAVTGLLAGGIACCLKHWPGHGGTAQDSHLGAAVLAGPPSAGPFVAGLAAGADAVMTAHILGPGAVGLPASLDPAQAAAARALAADRNLRLYADDITMGALRAPLAAAGVPGPATAGLIDPADLTAAWCRAVLAGGSDRLLVRGIPWGLYPDEPRGPQPATAAAANPEPAPDPSWQEARARLAKRLEPDFGAGAGVFLVDLTAGDRWGPLAAGEGAAPLPGDPTATAAGARRVLVASHRPLERAQEAAWAAVAAPRGQALGVGHPALAADLRALLPPGWRVTWLPEWPGPGLPQLI